MLLFIDQPKHIRVMRATTDASGALKRERLGLILKATLEPSPDLTAALTPTDADEVASAIDMYRRATKARRQSAALAFPETAREVVDYLRDDATDGERKIIVAALMEAVRAVRKAAREGAGAGDGVE